jgi:protein tyrosine/serine phosphatase
MTTGRLLTGLNALIVASVIAVGAAAGYGAILRATGNVHTVVNSVLYRSAQLTGAQFETVIRQYGIKSILNLRGGTPTDPWYTAEVSVSKNRGVAHLDHAISAHRRVTPEQIADLLSILRRAPKPLLIHCRSGADRSGLVAALFLLLEVEHDDPTDAGRQLSLAYSHFPYLLSKTVAMDESFWAYAKSASSLSALVR